MLLASLPVVASAVESVPDGDVAHITANKASEIYLVLMADDPAAAYEGGISGLAATRPGVGDRLDRRSPAVAAYADFLRARHAEARASAGIASDAVVYDYVYSGNGFAARMTSTEAARLAASPDVVAVLPDEIRHITTDSSPDFLGLSHQQGPWATGYTGEDIVIGVIDTGIWPEHPSFADDGSYGAAPARFGGTACEFGSAVGGAQDYNTDDADHACNNKLLTARVFGEGYHGGTGEGLDPGEYLSARDADGHGSHTASTAGGNGNVPASVLDREWGTVSGVAPRARIAAYKACWSSSPTAGGCAVSDLVAAIDQAVGDGVDVINYSIGSDATTLGADDIAFLAAAKAGVKVATSAGNSGPGSSTVGSPATVPWVTSVAAATQARDFQGTVTLGFGAELTGVTLTGGTEELPLLGAADLGNPLCDPEVAFTAPIDGAIVLCERGAIARVAKSLAVSEQGGAGMILANTDPDDSLNTDNHYVPSLHVSSSDGAAIAAYLESAGPDATAELGGGQKVTGTDSVVAAFSSRGPNGLSEDILKPDVAAPGVNILAANTPTALLGAPGELFQAISGTSMSSPHVAGVYALITQAHPRWTPAMAKSALMTTARHDVWKEDGVTPAEVFDTGSGYIQPGGNIHQKGSLFNPGLVYDATIRDYRAFLCGAGYELGRQGSCDRLEGEGYSTAATDLNVASLGVAGLVGTETVTRTVTSVADKIRAYEAQVREPAGFDIEVEPATLVLAPGESASFTVTITRTNAPAGEWRFGSLSWNSAGYKVQSPLAVRAFDFVAPDEVVGGGTTGAASFDVTFGYTGDYSAAPHGLIPAATAAGVVVDDPANDINEALTTGVGVTFHTIEVPEDSAYARFSLFDDATDGSDDLDLYVFGPDDGFIGGSGSGTSAEEVSVTLPEAGTYTIAVHGWETDGPDAAYTLFSWSVPLESGGSLVVDSAPNAAVQGDSGTVTVSWSALDAETRYLGAVSHNGPAGLQGLTVVAVDTASASAATPAPAPRPQGTRAVPISHTDG